MVRRRFELGDGTSDDVIAAEQPLADNEAKIQQLQLLLDMYRSLGTDQSPSAN